MAARALPTDLRDPAGAHLEHAAILLAALVTQIQHLCTIVSMRKWLHTMQKIGSVQRVHMNLVSFCVAYVREMRKR